jgi:hypothetical protein
LETFGKLSKLLIPEAKLDESLPTGGTAWKKAGSDEIGRSSAIAPNPLKSATNGINVIDPQIVHSDHCIFLML